MRIEDLFEMSPQRVNDFDFELNNVVRNHLYALQLLEKKYQVLKKISDTVTLCEFSGSVAMLDTTPDKEEILFIVEYKTENITLIQSVALTQFALWSNAARPETHQVPKYVFFDILLPKTQTIMTDSKQTWHGERFWLNRIKDAFGMNLNIYFIQLISPFIVKLVPSHVALNSFIRQYKPWGKDIIHRRRGFIITNKTFDEHGR